MIDVGEYIVYWPVSDGCVPLAQLVERRSHNPEVVSSILTGGTPIYTWHAQHVTMKTLCFLPSLCLQRESTVRYYFIITKIVPYSLP